MNIVKKGNKPYIYYAKCEGCGSIISFVKAELDWSRRFACPICRNTVYTGLYENNESDPYLGNEEVKKEIEEYLANQEKTGASMEPVPNSKKDEADDNPKGNIINAEEIKGILEEILREVRVESAEMHYKNPPTKEDAPVIRGPYPLYPYEYRPYEPSKTNDWTNRFYYVTTVNL